MLDEQTINYLRELEKEAIFIIREVVAEFKNPVMLFSIGKDSCVMSHLAKKAFLPGKNAKNNVKRLGKTKAVK